MILCELQSRRTVSAGKVQQRRTSVSQLFLGESVTHRLVTYMHTCGLLEVYLHLWQYHDCVVKLEVEGSGAGDLWNIVYHLGLNVYRTLLLFGSDSTV